jgi:hypothetical protein
MFVLVRDLRPGNQSGPESTEEDNGMMDIDDEGGFIILPGIYSIIAICELEVLGLQIT